MSSKPLLIPEPFSGDCGNWQEWIDHFESVAVVNKWDTDGDKLKWLRVRLTGKAHTVFMKLPENTRKDYGECVKALKKRFFPIAKRSFTWRSCIRGQSGTTRTGHHLVTP